MKRYIIIALFAFSAVCLSAPMWSLDWATTGGAVDPLADWPDTANLVAAYSFAADGVTDDSGNGHTLVYPGGGGDPTYIDANNGLLFDGSDYAELGTSTSLLNGLATATIQAWVKKTSGSTQGVLFPSGSTEFGFQTSSTPGIRGFANGVATGYETFSFNVWALATMVWDSGASPRGKLYVNGVYVQSAAAGAGTLSVSVKTILGSFNAGSQFHIGNIDDVGLWQTALTSNEVFSFYTDTSGNH